MSWGGNRYTRPAVPANISAFSPSVHPDASRLNAFHKISAEQPHLSGGKLLSDIARWAPNASRQVSTYGFQALARSEELGAQPESIHVHAPELRPRKGLGTCLPHRYRAVGSGRTPELSRKKRRRLRGHRAAHPSTPSCTTRPLSSRSSIPSVMCRSARLEICVARRSALRAHFSFALRVHEAHVPMVTAETNATTPCRPLVTDTVRARGGAWSVRQACR